MPKRERYAALAGAILLTIALPIAIDQGYFRYNPYPLPILGLIAILLYLAFVITSSTCRKIVSSLYSKNPKLSLIGFIVIGTIGFSLLGVGEWLVLNKSKEHVNRLRAEDKQKPPLKVSNQSKQPTVEEIASEVAKKLPQPQAGIKDEIELKLKKGHPQTAGEKNTEKKMETHPSDTQEKIDLKRKFAALGYPPKGWEEGWDMSKGMPCIVALRFVHTKSPALIIDNIGVSVARDIKWTLVLWNMELPDRSDPLPIPVQTFDWIKGGGKGGPMNLFNTPLVSPLLKLGNHLIGSASVDCPACASPTSYIVYIVWGEGGWFAEVKYEKFRGQLVVPKNISNGWLEKYLYDMETLIPIDARLPIREQ